MSNNLAPVIEELRSAFTQLADRLFVGSDMPMPVIHVPHKDNRRKGMSWYKTAAWNSTESEVLNILAGIGGSESDIQSLAEIAIAAEGLDRDLNIILGDLLHEMVHHFNFTRGNKDLGQSRHHTQSFHGVAHSLGLWATDDSCNTFMFDRVGYHYPNGDYRTDANGQIVQGPKLTDVFDGLNLNRDVFDLSRLTTTKTTRPGSKLLKYSCGCTNARVATKFDARCNLCGNDFAGPL